MTFLIVMVIGMGLKAADAASLTFDWGGRIKASGERSFPDKKSLYHEIDAGPYDDGRLDGRLLLSVYNSTFAQLDLHYESVYFGGDLKQVQNRLTTNAPTAAISRFFNRGVEDGGRLMDLTRTLHEGDRQSWYHRIDRMVLTMTPTWGTVRIGRQALTWGNGLIFNPMDVFNPFSPTDVERDYKTGDDMIAVTAPTISGNEYQMVAVGHRNRDEGHVTIDDTSLAGKFHGRVDSLEYDIMGARHYDDYIIGAGLSGYLKDAAWRMDAVYTFLNNGYQDDGFWSFVINIDYSWNWFNKNWYGLIEWYGNSLGEANLSNALEELSVNTDLSDRLIRGEIFTLGTGYLAAGIQLELHPLVNVHLSAITNVTDPSGVLQPRLVWDVADNLQLSTGAIIYWGGGNTEFGGFSIPNTDCDVSPLDQIYCWVSYYF